MILQSYKKQYRDLQHAMGQLNPHLTIQKTCCSKFSWYRRGLCLSCPQHRVQQWADPLVRHLDHHGTTLTGLHPPSSRRRHLRGQTRRVYNS